jgi:hypothetical protein
MHRPSLLDRNNRPLLDAQTRCNSIWKEIALERGLNWESIAPAPKHGFEYFSAVPLLKEDQDATLQKKVIGITRGSVHKGRMDEGESNES